MFKHTLICERGFFFGNSFSAKRLIASALALGADLTLLPLWFSLANGGCHLYRFSWRYSTLKPPSSSLLMGSLYYLAILGSVCHHRSLIVNNVRMSWRVEMPCLMNSNRLTVIFYFLGFCCPTVNYGWCFYCLLLFFFFSFFFPFPFNIIFRKYSRKFGVYWKLKDFSRG